MASKKSKNGAPPRVLNPETLKKILDENGDKVVAHVFNEAVQLALYAKHGKGIIQRAMITDEHVDEMRELMGPLVDAIRYQASAGFARVMDDILSDTEYGEYFRRRPSAIFGATGGRPADQKPHIVWLQNVLRPMLAMGYSRKECVAALLNRSEIAGEDEGRLLFTDRMLDQFDEAGKLAELAITSSAISTAITRLNKERKKGGR